MDRAKPPRDEEAVPPKPDEPARTPDDDELRKPNPPYTTSGGITAPKFGSAGSGGAEIEPGVERD